MPSVVCQMEEQEHKLERRLNVLEAKMDLLCEALLSPQMLAKNKALSDQSRRSTVRFPAGVALIPSLGSDPSSEVVNLNT